MQPPPFNDIKMTTISLIAVISVTIYCTTKIIRHDRPNPCNICLTGVFRCPVKDTTCLLSLFILQE